MDDERGHDDPGRHAGADGIAFTRSARKHRIAYDDMRHALRHSRHVTSQPALDPNLDDRLLVPGPAIDGTPLDLVVTVQPDGAMLVIHAMRMRRRYRALYDDGGF
jgi:hypothetical protein